MDAMTGEDRRKLQELLTKAMHDLRDVSTRHEDALGDLGRPEHEVPASELARRQTVYKEALESIGMDLYEASKLSLFVSPMLGRAVFDIAEKVDWAAGQLAGGRRGRAQKEMKWALGAMNEMIAGLMDAQQQSSCCSSPSGMSEAFQQLESMCCKQMGINQGTLDLMRQGQQGLSLEARAGMARLAAEQEAVKQGIEDLADQLSGRGEILGRLDDLIEEAERVIEDLRNRGVDQETLRRQERILTRLLNAQKSMRRRDYSRRRKSRPGEVYDMASPPPLPVRDLEQEMQDLLYRKRGYYPPEYEALIREYFKAISTKRLPE
jgi:hypothetical protein